MNTKEKTKEKIEVMQAFVDGKDIEYFNQTGNDDKWHSIIHPSWRWDLYHYRVKPEEKWMNVFKNVFDESIIKTVRIYESKEAAEADGVTSANSFKQYKLVEE